jgi:hypothetical protein
MLLLHVHVRAGVNAVCLQVCGKTQVEDDGSLMAGTRIPLPAWIEFRDGQEAILEICLIGEVFWGILAKYREGKCCFF